MFLYRNFFPIFCEKYNNDYVYILGKYNWEWRFSLIFSTVKNAKWFYISIENLGSIPKFQVWREYDSF